MDSEKGQMPPILEFEILARGLYWPDQLDITYDPSLRMPINPAIQEWMDSLWEQKLAIAREKGVPLFDASLFLLIEAESKPDGRLHLVLGDTGYKEYVTTQVTEFTRVRQREELGKPLSICSVVETSDTYIFLYNPTEITLFSVRYPAIYR